MFNKARLKLTAWYLLIIMVISISFSVVIYRGATIEIERALSFQRFRMENPQGEFIFPKPQRRILLIDPEVLQEAKRRIAFWLAGINTVILITSGTAGFFLAGKTLKPISEMIDEQNRFVSDASHELRTPLTSLKTSVEVNLRDKKLNLKTAKKLLEDNLEEINKLQSLSDSLLQLTRPQNNKQNGFENISTAEIIQESVKKIQSQAKKKKIIIQTKISDFEIKGNKENLIQLIVILLDNAIKYSPENKKVEITAQKKDNFTLLSVKDEGIGIEEKDLPFIFDRFYRADSSRTKTQSNGYGLGLAIAKKITKDHKGGISVASNPNKGSTFTVKIPLSFSLFSE